MAKKRKKSYKPTKKVAEKPEAVNKVEAKPQNDYFKGQESKIFLIIASVLLLFLFIDFIAQEKLFLYTDIGSDTALQFYPTYKLKADMIEESGFLTEYSFKQGAGRSMVHGINYVNNPLKTLMFLLVDGESLPYALAYFIIFSLLLGGVLFHLYLRAMKMSSFSSVLGGLLYGFCGFMIVETSWWGHIAIANSVVFFLFAFERYFVGGKWFLLPLAGFFLLSKGFLFFPMSVFLIGYVTIRYFSDRSGAKGYLILIIKLFGFVCLGALMATFTNWINVEKLLNNPRVFGAESKLNTLPNEPIFKIADYRFYLGLLRVFGNDIIGNGNKFYGFPNMHEAAILYSGLMTLLLIPQIFFGSSKRTKITFAVAFSIIGLVILFPYFRYMFWFFSGDYFREFGLAVTIIFIFTGMQVLNKMDKGKKLNIPALLITSGVLVAILLYPYTMSDIDAITGSTRTFSIIFLIIYTVLLVVISKNGFSNLYKIILLVLVGIEVFYLSNSTINDRPLYTVQQWESRTGFNDYTNEAIDYLDERDNSFWRINKDFRSGNAHIEIGVSLNDSKVQGYRGTAFYDSSPDKNYVAFHKAMNIPFVTDNVKYSVGMDGRIVLQTIMNVKYQISNKPIKHQIYNWPVLDSIKAFPGVKVYELKESLPFGFTYDGYIRQQDFMKFQSNLAKEEALLRMVILDNDVKADEYKGMKEYTEKDSMNKFTYEYHLERVRELKQDTMTLEEHSDTYFKGNIKLEKPKFLFFSIIFNPHWKMYINGEQAEMLRANVGFMGKYLEPGEYEIELKFESPYKLPLAVTMITLIGYLAFGVILQLRKKKTNSPQEEK
jgi:hypothetical protein